MMPHGGRGSSAAARRHGGTAARGGRAVGRGLGGALALVVAAAGPAAGVQIGDLARIKGSENSKLVGMGLVVGLAGTGDGGRFGPAMEPLARVIRHFINEDTVAGELRDAKNVAMVALEASTPRSGAREGDLLDLHVSAVGAAKSLRGGRLLMMPMTGPLPDSPVFAYASGPVKIEDALTPTVGVIRDGAQLVRDISSRFVQDGMITLVLKAPNATFPIASTIAATINAMEPEGPPIATAIDQKNVVVAVPGAELASPVPFLGAILTTYVDAAFIQTGGRVRINERTGTIVMSGDVEISPVAVSHGDMTIEVNAPSVGQAPQTTTHHTVALDPGQRGGVKLNELIAAFNQLNVGIEDRIAILKEIDRMGKLHAELVFD